MQLEGRIHHLLGNLVYITGSFLRSPSIRV